MTLVLERRPYSYMKYCSDINGQDPSPHHGSPKVAIQKVAIQVVRDWLRTHSEFGMPSGAIMVTRFARFQRSLPRMCEALRLDHHKLIFSDYAVLVSEWLKENSEPQPLRRTTVA